VKVERVEDLGDSSIVSFHFDDQLLKLKSERIQRAAEGDDAFVAFAPDAVHLFDPASGARL
jgi:ABC-type sugar transport system ATPase subunit